LDEGLRFGTALSHLRGKSTNPLSTVCARDKSADDDPAYRYFGG
jgi:hypothetical protein